MKIPVVWKALILAVTLVVGVLVLDFIKARVSEGEFVVGLIVFALGAIALDAYIQDRQNSHPRSKDKK